MADLWEQEKKQSFKHLLIRQRKDSFPAVLDHSVQTENLIYFIKFDCKHVLYCDVKVIHLDLAHFRRTGNIGDTSRFQLRSLT